jgi:lipopolysaccharide transport system permease protein
MSQLRELKPGASLTWGGLKELWEARDVLALLLIRDLKVRYRQAVIGVLWALFQPVLLMLVFPWLFHRLGANPASEAGRPYLFSIFLGLLCWQFFAQSVREGTTSIVSNRNLITKVYFPRLLLPLSTVCAAAADFAVAATLLVPLMLWFGILPTPHIFLAVPFVLLVVVWSACCSIWASALNALYRDVGHTVPFLLLMGMFVSPVVFETSVDIPHKWYWLWGLNPLVTGIEGLRGAVFGTGFPGPELVLPGLFVTAIGLIGGVSYFSSVETWIADRV